MVLSALSPMGISIAVLVFLLTQCEAQHTMDDIMKKIIDIESSLISTRTELLSKLDVNKLEGEKRIDELQSRLATEFGLAPSTLSSSSSSPVNLHKVISDLRSCQTNIGSEISSLPFDELKSELTATLNGNATKLEVTLAAFESQKNSESATLMLESKRIDELQSKINELGSKFEREKNSQSAGQHANCKELLDGGTTQSGVYTIFPEGFSDGVRVFCDQHTDGGGWTVFLQRNKGTSHVNFARTFEEYAAGFGDPSTEFWIGNRVIHSMTRDGPFTLRVDAMNIQGQRRYGIWDTFMVGSAFTWFTLTVRDFSNTKSTLKDALANGAPFSAMDIDNDGVLSDDCSGKYGRGGWWFASCSEKYNFWVNPTAPLGNENSWHKAHWGFWETPRTPIGLSEIQFKIRPPQK